MPKPLRTSPPQTVMLVGVEPHSLLNFRKPLIEELRRRGYGVTVVSLPPNEQQKQALQELGATIAPVNFSRAGMNPLRDLRTLFALARVFRQHRPERIITYTAKPTIYGAMAASIARSPKIVAMITGLGYSFVAGKERKRQLARAVATSLYKVALRHASVVVFQNPDDLKVFSELSLMPRSARTGIVNGSGVDTNHFHEVPLPQKPVFLMVARLLADKGIREYVAASKALRNARPEARTLLLGGLDSSPNSVTQAELDQWIAEGLEHLPHTDDVRPTISAASVVVLPSYREGTPRSVLEGMAMGRAIITTDAPGCRETIQHGKSGFLIEPQNTDALLAAMIDLTDHRDKREAMGEAARKRACEKYEGGTVARAVLDLAGLS